MKSNNHGSVIDTATGELRDDQLDKVTGGIIAVLIGLLVPEPPPPPPPPTTNK